MKADNWQWTQFRNGVVVAGRIVLACFAMFGAFIAALDCLWSEGRLSTYGHLRPWPFLGVAVIVSGWLAVRGLPLGADVSGQYIHRAPGTRWLRTDVRYMGKRELLRSSGEFLLSGVAFLALPGLVWLRTAA